MAPPSPAPALLRGATVSAEIMAAANARKLTIAGIPVRVSGMQLDFARVTIADRRHALYGWQSEYSWEAIERATNGSGKLS